MSRVVVKSDVLLLPLDTEYPSKLYDIKRTVSGNSMDTKRMVRKNFSPSAQIKCQHLSCLLNWVGVIQVLIVFKKASS